MKPQSPCYKCQNRHINCHATCEGYQEFHRKNAEINSIIKQAKDKESIAISVVVRAAEKAKKRRLQRGEK